MAVVALCVDATRSSTPSASSNNSPMSRSRVAARRHELRLDLPTGVHGLADQRRPFDHERTLS